MTAAKEHAAPTAATSGYTSATGRRPVFHLGVVCAASSDVQRGLKLKALLVLSKNQSFETGCAFKLEVSLHHPPTSGGWGEAYSETAASLGDISLGLYLVPLVELARRDMLWRLCDVLSGQSVWLKQ